MTLAEFDEKVFSVGELYDLAMQEDAYDVFEDVISPDYISDEIQEMIPDYISNHSWEDLRDELNDINLDGDLFVRSDYNYFGYVCIDDDQYLAEDYKSNLREYLINADYFESEEDDEPEDMIMEIDPETGEVIAPSEWYEKEVNEEDMMALFS